MVMEGLFSGHGMLIVLAFILVFSCLVPLIFIENTCKCHVCDQRIKVPEGKIRIICDNCAAPYVVLPIAQPIGINVYVWDEKKQKFVKR